MKIPALGFKSKVRAFRAVFKLRGFCRKLKRAVVKIFIRDEPENEDDDDENNILLNLFGIIELRRNANTHIHVAPKIIKPQVIATPYRPKGPVTVTSYERIKDVFRRWNDIMDLMYSI